MLRVYKFNPKKYQGKWYELGKYPVKYEPTECAYSTAEYRYNAKGNYLNVLNTCYNDNEEPVISITGIAKPQNDQGDLLIKFYPESFSPYPVSPVPQPYNVLWTDYDNFAFVGNDDSYYILVRNLPVYPDDYDFIQRMTRNLGYDISKVKFNNYLL